jgi:hypothetical protein
MMLSPKLWEQEVFALLLAEGRITEDVVANMRSWKHSGFSVDQSVRLEAGDQEGIQRLIQYFLRCPFSQARMIEVTVAGKVIYKTEHNTVGRFPEPGDQELLAGPSRNFQVFEPLGFLAEVTQHIPDAGERGLEANHLFPCADSSRLRQSTRLWRRHVFTTPSHCHTVPPSAVRSAVGCLVAWRPGRGDGGIRAAPPYTGSQRFRDPDPANRRPDPH